MTSASDTHAVSEPAGNGPDGTIDQDLLAGPRGNERLTAWAGAALFVLLAVEGVTILDVHAMFTLHVVTGFVLVGPLAVKLGSTGYRFVRYYAGDPAYRHSGPPQIVLRVLAPFLVVATGVVFATGFALVLFPSWHHYSMERLHTASFFVWFALAAVHVVYYVWRLPRLMTRDVLETVGLRPAVQAVSGNGWVRVAVVFVSAVIFLVAAKVIL